jgi:hypothetical protein
VITTGGERFSVGERITVEADAYDEKFEPLKAKTFDVEMIDVNTGDSRSVTLEAVNDKGRYTGTVVPSRTGVYELTALKGDPQAAEKVAVKRLAIELPQAESERTEADETTLQSIASRPENFVRAWEADKLASIPSGRLVVPQEVPRELWDTRATLLLLVALLAVEWILRKKYNMA